MSASLPGKPRYRVPAGSNKLPSAVRAAEGEYRPGPYFLSDGVLSASVGKYWNWWQLGHSPQPYGNASSMVEACISKYAQTIAMCPGDHWVTRPDGGRDRRTTAQSALARRLVEPNDYQQISDFLANLVRSWLSDGNAYVLAVRNARFEIEGLHLMHPRHSCVRYSETGDVFYELGGNEIVERRYGSSLLVPARDVMHVRTQAPGIDPLKGVSPIVAAALDMAAGDAVLRQQIAFFLNQSRTNFVLTSDEKLTPEEAKAAREAWDSMTTGANAGRTPILSWGFKPIQVHGTATDAQLVETLKMSDQRIALAFGVPLQILGIGGQSTMGSTEALMNSWLSSGLGFAINHVELAFDKFFRLRGQPEEYTEFNTRVLLRSNFKERIEALAVGLTSGLYVHNEARNSEDLGAVEFGDAPRIQQQMVPLSYGAQLQPPQPAPPAAQPEPEPEDDGERHNPEDIVQRLYEYAGTAH